MKKFILLLIIVALSARANAQSASNTIQITVSEKVELAAVEYVYTVANHGFNLGDIYGELYNFDEYEDDDEEYNYEYNEEENEYETIQRKRKSISEIAGLLQKAKFVCTIIDDSSFEVDASEDEGDEKNDPQQLIEIRVKSLEELRRLSAEVAKIEDAYGQVTDVLFENLSTKYDAVYPTLMNAAKLKAKALASAANKSVGDVIQIEEGSEETSIFGGQWENYMEQLMSMRELFGNEKVKHSKEVTVTMTYVFELK